MFNFVFLKLQGLICYNIKLCVLKCNLKKKKNSKMRCLGWQKCLASFGLLCLTLIFPTMKRWCDDDGFCLPLPILSCPPNLTRLTPLLPHEGFFFCPKEGMEWVQDTYDPTLSSLIAIPIRSLCSFDLWHITTLWGVSMPSQLLLKKKKKFPYLFPLVKGMSYI